MNREKKFLIHYNNLNTNKISSIRELILKDYILNNFCNISYDDIQDKDDYYIKKIFELEEILNY